MPETHLRSRRTGALAACTLAIALVSARADAIEPTGSPPVHRLELFAGVDVVESSDAALGLRWVARTGRRLAIDVAVSRSEGDRELLRFESAEPFGFRPVFGPRAGIWFAEAGVRRMYRMERRTHLYVGVGGGVAEIDGEVHPMLQASFGGETILGPRTYLRSEIRPEWIGRGTGDANLRAGVGVGFVLPVGGERSSGPGA